MKERQILFQGAMVRALLAGTKTQTRRAIKAPDSVTYFQHFDGATWDRMQGKSRGDSVRCPYGQPGDRLWVRETWQAIDGNERARRIMAQPNPSRGWIGYAATVPEGCEPPPRWRPSIHMPRWASRITLEVTEIRVERLQDISEADALAEGIVPTGGGFGLPDGSHFHGTDPRVSYWSLWESINGPGSVEANPWVWVLEFKRVEAAA